MNENICIKLREARKLYDSKKYMESLELYEQLFNENPIMFNKENPISYWQDFMFKDKELKHGTFMNNFEDNNYGFIEDLYNGSKIIHKSKVKGDNLYVNYLVSSYRENSFDKSQNKQLLTAVNFRGE